MVMTERYEQWGMTAACILAVAIALAAGNGGIEVGSSNHHTLLPVVRRILDPNYLPGDFGVELRLSHHRGFALVIASLARVIGEDQALILLSVLGTLLLSGALYDFCRSVGLRRAGYLALGAWIATGMAWAGRGLEQNTFVGNSEVQPPLFAHAFVLFGVASYLRGSRRLPVLFAALATLTHLQIGIIFALALAPLYLIELRELGWKEALKLALIYLLPSAPALAGLLAMSQRGLLASSAISWRAATDLRQPHHFELISAAAGWWVAAHLAALALVYFFLRRRARTEAARVRPLLALAALLGLYALLHFFDYYIWQNGAIARLQFIRMSPLITAFGAAAVTLAIELWARERSVARAPALVAGALIVCAALWGWYQVKYQGAQYYFGVRRYAARIHSWNDACRWIAANTPREARFLTPPGTYGFTYLTDRSTVVDFKTNPDGNLGLDAWLARITDLGGGELPRGHGVENRRLLNDVFSRFSAEQLIALGEKYHAGYALLPKASQAELEVLYRNNQYRVVKIPIKEP
jgi:hypothetical protein